MKKIIHINQHVIRSNARNGTSEPPVTVRTYKEITRSHGVIIKDKDGNEVARVIYRPDKPLSCGARVWIETKNEVEELPPTGQAEKSTSKNRTKCIP